MMTVGLIQTSILDGPIKKEIPMNKRTALISILELLFCLSSQLRSNLIFNKGESKSDIFNPLA
jgi:hypothetical protein